MKTRSTGIEGLTIVEPQVYADERGAFFEVFHDNRYRKIGIGQNFVQTNSSRSRRGVLRGLHFQRLEPQGKLVQVVRGEVFDVAVDLRVSSPTFGRWFGVQLNDQNRFQLYVPPGFAHGFCVTSDEADVLYFCTAYYQPDDEGGVLWSDEDLDIDWPIEQPLVSPKDGRFPRLRDIPRTHLFK